MPYMSLVTVINGGEDFENRFVGHEVVRAHDVTVRHRRFSEIAADMPRLVEGLLHLFRKVVDTGEPLAYCGRVGGEFKNVEYTDSEGVLLPFGMTDEAVDHVLYVGTCSTCFHPSSRFSAP
jgi:hypothetical protein